MKKIIADTDMYYIAYNEDKSIIHAGEIPEGNQLVTVMTELEEFFDETDWKTRAEELGYVFPVDEEVLA